MYRIFKKMMETILIYILYLKILWAKKKKTNRYIQLLYRKKINAKNLNLNTKTSNAKIFKLLTR